MKGRCKSVSLCKHSSKSSDDKTIQFLPESKDKPHRETHFCACPDRKRCRGSYTLEAAVILPLAAGFFVAVLFFFRILQIQTGVQQALTVAGRKTACTASVVDSHAALLIFAEVCMAKETASCSYVDRYVAGGRAGISLLRSDFSGDYVDIRADYFIKLPFNFLGLSGITVSQSSRSRKWTGDRDRGGAAEDYVYVTENGSVYHRNRGCSYLDLSIRAISGGQVNDSRNENGNKYYACSRCAANNFESNAVYITDYGTVYHKSLSCSGLKRTVYMVLLSEVGGKGACSKCGSP